MSAESRRSSAPVRVLFVEDSDDDVLLMLRALRQSGYETVHGRVDNATALRKALDGHTWDIAVIDYDLPRFSAPEALGVVRDRGLDLPCITVSGVMAEELVLSTMRHGAADYILKSNLARLGAVVERELASAAARRVESRRQHALLHREVLSRAILDNLPDPLVVVDDDGRIELFNHAAEVLLGYAAGEVLGSEFMSIFADEPRSGPTLGRRKTGEPVPLELAVGVTRPGERSFRAVLLRPVPNSPTTLDCP